LEKDVEPFTGKHRINATDVHVRVNLGAGGWNQDNALAGDSDRDT